MSTISSEVGRYADRLADQISIELAKVTPGFAPRLDILDLLIYLALRRVLVVSAVDDLFSHDANRVARIDRNRYAEDRAVTHECFDDIVRRLVQCADWSRVGECPVVLNAVEILNPKSLSCEFFRR